jgi:hexosaminidase
VSVIPKTGEFRFDQEEYFVLSPDGNAELKKIAEYAAPLFAAATGKKFAVRAGDKSKYAVILLLENKGSKPDDERYQLMVTPFNAIIRAPNPTGIFHGVQTLRQMLDAGGKSRPASIPAAVIEDAPRYPWRGISFDCARHFVSKEMVKRYIELLAYHKMNVFHWHLTDDQGWRIEIKKYPRLTEIGAWRDEFGERHGGFYTQDDIREVVAYAKSRYVTVVPEIEMPGHATSALAAYPEFSCTGEPLTVEPVWGVFPNLFCAGKEETFTFLEDVLREVAALFPSPYLHIGGDEAAKDKWKICPRCQKRIKDEGLADEAALQGYFSRRMDTFIHSIGRTMIGWDEILEGKPSPTAIVESWRGMEGAVEGASAGHQIISAPSGFVYFDYPELDEHAHISWMRVTDLAKTYSFEATPKELTPAQASFILGGECAIWTEHIREYELDYKLFPRLCAFCETVWTPGERRDWSDFSRRMETHCKRLAALGVDYFTPSSPVGSWMKGEVTEAGKTLEFNVSRFIRKPGVYRFIVRHDEGANGVAIERAALIIGGSEASVDTHPARSSTKRSEFQTYRLRVGEIRKGAPCLLRVTLRASGGADTKGSVLVRYFREK